MTRFMDLLIYYTILIIINFLIGKARGGEEAAGEGGGV